MYKTTGFLSFALRRLTGLALVAYLFMHIMVIGSANGGSARFDSVLNFVQTDFFKLLEIGLLAAVVYHAVDGIRLLIVHYFDVPDKEKSLFYAIFAVAAILVIAGGLPILLFMLEGK
ncbi:MAG: succinate dehydrogenase, cytochrome b556 subunit [Chloroflexota bacterium]|nr:succinate dehydrogenase, cytochrome b556 subunit [Chloroflexota bacterium]